MSKTKNQLERGAVHTPGPWTTDPECGNETVLGSDGIMVADCSITVLHVTYRTYAIDRANARLVAAAPDLLAACESALKRLAEPCGWDCDKAAAPNCSTCNQLRAAIAKTTGAA